MPKKLRLAPLDVVNIIVCLLVLAALIVYSLLPRGPVHQESRKVRCLSNLWNIAKAMNLYRNKYGDQTWYPIPAQSFRGDSWLASLHWSHTIWDPKLFLCPATEDRGRLPARPPRDLASASAVAPDAISYAGLCRGLHGPLAHRNTRTFTEAAISSSCLLACDDNEDSQNHADGICIVYFDSHAEFKAGRKADTYDLIGAKGGPYEYLDSGE